MDTWIGSPGLFSPYKWVICPLYNQLPTVSVPPLSTIPTIHFRVWSPVSFREAKKILPSFIWCLAMMRSRRFGLHARPPFSALRSVLSVDLGRGDTGRCGTPAFKGSTSPAISTVYWGYNPNKVVPKNSFWKVGWNNSTYIGVMTLVTHEGLVI